MSSPVRSSSLGRRPGFGMISGRAAAARYPTAYGYIDEPIARDRSRRGLSPDQCRLYFSTRRNGGVDIYVAERSP